MNQSNYEYHSFTDPQYLDNIYQINARIKYTSIDSDYESNEPFVAVVSARNADDAKDKCMALSREIISCSMFGQTNIVDPIITKGRLEFVSDDNSRYENC